MTAWTRTHALTYGEKHCFIMWTQNDVVIAMLRKIYDCFSRFALFVFFSEDSSFHELARDDTVDKRKLLNELGNSLPTRKRVPLILVDEGKTKP